MDKKLIEKLGTNALISERLQKLSVEEKHKIVLRLLMTRSERQLSEEIGVSHSTIHDWKSLRQDNTGENIHVSLTNMVLKLKALTPEKITDWGRIEQINEITNKLLHYKK
jgi:hypothetical protein